MRTPCAHDRRRIYTFFLTLCSSQAGALSSRLSRPFAALLLLILLWVSLIRNFILTGGAFVQPVVQPLFLKKFPLAA
jgi:hypothetical protein